MLTINFTLDGGLLSWNRKTKTLSTEMSDLQITSIPPQLAVYSTATGVTKVFTYIDRFLDETGEDLAGWKFGDSEGRTLIIFND